MRTKSKAILWILIVFVLGVLSGATASYLTFRSDGRFYSRREGRDPKQVVEKIADRLELDERQKEEFSKLLLETRDRHRQSFRTIEQETREKIRQILKPDQLKRYDEMREESRRRHRRNPNGRPSSTASPGE